MSMRCYFPHAGQKESLEDYLRFRYEALRELPPEHLPEPLKRRLEAINDRTRLIGSRTIKESVEQELVEDAFVGFVQTEGDLTTIPWVQLKI